jgi:hypothetical protein
MFAYLMPFMYAYALASPRQAQLWKAFETLLLPMHELILVEEKDQVILQPFEADASGDVRKSCSQ